MTSEGYAVIAAACFASSHVLAKLGFQDTSVTAGFLVSVSTAWLVIASAVALDPPRDVSLAGVVLFAAAGLFAPALARGAALMGVHRLGPSVAVPIQQGLRPVLAVVAATIVLGEAATPLRILGVVAIVAGGWALSRRPRDIPGVTGAFRPGVVFPVVAAVGYATADLISKRALDVLPEPAFGALVSTGAGLAAWGLAHLSRPLRRRLKVGPGVRWLAASGLALGCAMLTFFFALRDGDVSVVAPIVAAQPLIVFGLSVTLLGDIERLTRATVIAGVVVVAGTVLVVR